LSLSMRAEGLLVGYISNFYVLTQSRNRNRYCTVLLVNEFGAESMIVTGRRTAPRTDQSCIMCRQNLARHTLLQGSLDRKDPP
jgi:hypothetical protein